MNHNFSLAPPLPAWLTTEFPFQRRLFHHGDYTIHFVDEGSGLPVLLQHGNPTWSFLWRKVMRLLLVEGLRVIAPDLVGLGLSSKPRHAGVHTLAFHGGQIGALVQALDLQGLTIVGQDWGGPVVGIMAAQNPARIHGAVFANTGIRAPKRIARVTPFHRFSNMPLISDLAFRIFNLPVHLMSWVQGDRSSIGRLERRAYRYPLRAFGDRTATLALARMVPTHMAHSTIQSLPAVDAWARGFTGPVQLVWGMRDPILGPTLKGMRQLFPEAKVTETEAGHFLQEEVPEVLAQAILEVVDKR